ncbi:DUF6442 family protein [Lapidilactobacillus luobeiensis]|uniref:DUF6442 family protein n=1 Tax=Lapidilactobacillus luobeiensis TaxID=2950371 RepID=UPI0021C479BE|nr:DUF6442 family protein [Lapidilactobacillus luobeiensis]
MDKKRLLQQAQAEQQDEGRIKTITQLSLIHYIMLMVAWLIIFVLRLLAQQPTTDLFFMLLIVGLGHEVFTWHQQKSWWTALFVLVLLVAVATTGWSLVLPLLGR